MKQINVLSLFDGMSCGRVALERAGIPVNNYYASEVDKYAIQVSNKNWPDIIQLGDVTKWENWDIDFSSIDLIFAGFPCQAWSVAGKQKGDNDPRGALVHDLIAIWNKVKEVNPDVKFLFENVRMKKEFLDYISNDLFGVEPVRINSNLVSSQNRDRYYWCSADNVPQPKDKGLVLRDTLGETTIPVSKTKKYRKLSRVTTGNRRKTGCIEVGHAEGINGADIWKRVYSIDGKCPTLNAVQGGHQEKKVAIDSRYWRKLTPLEYERLQTLPDNYTEGVSNTQRYKMIGNGWTVDVIAHILKHMALK